MSIYTRWAVSMEPRRSGNWMVAQYFLTTFDLDIHHMPIDSFDALAVKEQISDIVVTSKIEDEPAATLVFLFLSDPKDLSTKVSHLTTYTSSEHPTIWVLVKEKHYPRTKEKIPSIWEPLTNAQYYEVRPTIKISNEKWIGTRFTIGRQSIFDIMQDKDMHMAITLTPQAQKRRNSLV